MTEHEAARLLNERRHLGCDTWRPCVYGGGVPLSPAEAIRVAKTYADNPPSPQDETPIRRRRPETAA